jgi:hypothetical protein
LLLKDGENITGRITGLELGGEWMCKKVVLSTFLVLVQGTIDDQLEVRRRRGSMLRMRHEGRCNRLFVQEGFVNDRAEENSHLTLTKHNTLWAFEYFPAMIDCASIMSGQKRGRRQVFLSHFMPWWSRFTTYNSDGRLACTLARVRLSSVSNILYYAPSILYTFYY